MNESWPKPFRPAPESQPGVCIIRAQRSLEVVMQEVVVLVGCTRRRTRRGPLVSFLLSLVACAGDVQPPFVEYRDSAGVSIAESSRPQWSVGEEWRLDTVPFLALSGTGPAYEFYEVEDATLLKDGRLVVLDGGSHQVRYYDSNGSFLYAMGQEGEGPGDFKRLANVSTYRGDSVLVFDYWLSRSMATSRLEVPMSSWVPPSAWSSGGPRRADGTSRSYARPRWTRR